MYEAEKFSTVNIREYLAQSSDAESFSNTVKRKISRVSELDEVSHSYNLSAYLIAQIGENYTNEQNKRITGKELLELAIDQVKDMQYLAGGMVIFLEAEDKEPLMKFYRDENNFKSFNTREAKSMVSESHMLVQLLKTL